MKIVTPETEQQLVEWAQCATAAQFEKVVAGRRSVDRRDPDDRYVSWITQDDGSFVLRARLSAEEGALVIAALQSARDALSTGDDAKSVSAETLLRPSNADAFVAMAETTLAHGPTPVSGGDRHMVLVHVNAETNAARLDSGHAIDAETAAMLRCDAAQLTILRGEEGEPLAMGRKTREPSVAQRRALNVRDGCCAFPGCTQRVFVDAHHVDYWENGGRTDVGNLVLLCRVHHRAVHHRGYRIEKGPHQTFRFFRGDGLELIAAPPAATPCISDPAIGAGNDSITPDTAVPEWDGYHPDYATAVEGLLWLEEHRGPKEQLGPFVGSAYVHTKDLHHAEPGG